MIRITKEKIFFTICIIVLLNLITTKSLFGLVSFSTLMVWILGILLLVIFFFLYMSVFKAKYPVKLIAPVSILLVVVVCTVGFVTKGITLLGKVGSGNQEIVVDSVDQWIWYTGSNSNLFTFKYPKNYVIDESSTSVFVYANEEAKSHGGDHLTFSQYPADPESRFDIIAECESFSKMMVEQGDNSVGKDYQFRYARVISLGDIRACDAGISLIQADSPQDGRMYEFSLSFIANKTNYGIIGYAQKESGLDIFHRIAETFQLK